MIPARSWLPQSALRDGVLTDALTACVQTWTDRWFAAPIKPQLRLGFGPGQEDAEETAWETTDGGMTLVASRRSQLHVALAMLGITPPVAKPSSADHIFFGRLTAPAFEDLIRDAAQALSTPPTSRKCATPRSQAQETTLKFSVALDQEPHVLEFYIEEPAAIAARRARLAPAHPSPSLARRSEAIAKQSIEISALIGRCTVTLAELRSCSCGDVLVLDRLTQDHLELVIDGEIKPQTCRLEQDSGSMSLKLAHP